MSTSALCVGGNSPASGITESWNGSAWAETGDLNTARQYLGASGTTSAALAFGGGPPNLAVNEDWNGSTWSEVGDLNTTRFQLAGAGSYTSALAFGGANDTALTAATEEWSGSSNLTKVLTD